MINAVCAWCGRGLGIRDWADKGVTHGICPRCKHKALKNKNYNEHMLRRIANRIHKFVKEKCHAL